MSHAAPPGEPGRPCSVRAPAVMATIVDACLSAMVASQPGAIPDGMCADARPAPCAHGAEARNRGPEASS